MAANSVSSGVSCVPPPCGRTLDGGISGFLRLPAGADSDAFAEHAKTRHGVVVIPGSFFQAKDHVRQSQERASQARAVHDARPATA